jgi:predicted transcriptional regulator
MPMPKRLQVTNVRLDDELKAELKKLADKAERPLANYIVRVLRHHVDEQKKNPRPLPGED